MPLLRSKHPSTKVSVVGLGSIWPMYYQAISKHKNFRLLSVADLDKKKNPHFNDVPFYDSHHSLIEAEKPDLVIVATPPASHFAITKDLLQEGISVVCEKPATTKQDHVQELVELASSKKILFYPAYHAAYNPTYLSQRNLLKTHIDKIKFVEIRYKEMVTDYHPKSSWLFDPKISGGGCIADSGINLFSILTDLFCNLSVDKVTITRNGLKVETKAVILLSNSNTQVRVIMDWLCKEEEKSFKFYFDDNKQLDFDFVNKSEGRAVNYRMDHEYINMIRDVDKNLTEIDQFKPNCSPLDLVFACYKD